MMVGRKVSFWPRIPSVAARKPRVISVSGAEAETSRGPKKGPPCACMPAGKVDGIRICVRKRPFFKDEFK